MPPLKTLVFYFFPGDQEQMTFKKQQTYQIFIELEVQKWDSSDAVRVQLS